MIEDDIIIVTKDNERNQLTVEDVSSFMLLRGVFYA